MIARALTRPTALAAAAVLVGGLCFAVGSLTAADAGSGPVTKAQVKKIAAKQAKKAITKAAPTLSVAHADSADTATSATNLPLKQFGIDIAPDAAPLVVANVAGVTLTATCPGGIPTLDLTAPNGRLHNARLSNNTVLTGGSSDLSGGFQAGLAGTTSGTGSFNYKSTTDKPVSGTYGWRNDNARCQFFGTVTG